MPRLLASDPTLNRREEAFAQAIAAGFTAAEANRKAGYSPNASAKSTTSKVEGMRRLKRPKVAARIKQLQERNATKFEVTAREQYMKLERIRLAAELDRDHKAGVQAVVAQNRMFGLDVQQVVATLRVPSADPDSPDEMSEAEWMAAAGVKMIEHDPNSASTKPQATAEAANWQDSADAYTGPI